MLKLIQQVFSSLYKFHLLTFNPTFSVTAPDIQVLAPWSWGHIQGKTEYSEDTTPPSVSGVDIKISNLDIYTTSLSNVLVIGFHLNEGV